MIWEDVFVWCTTLPSWFSLILHCVKMRKGDTINFRFGGKSTTFCNSGSTLSEQVNNVINKGHDLMKLIQFVFTAPLKHTNITLFPCLLLSTAFLSYDSSDNSNRANVNEGMWFSPSCELSFGLLLQKQHFSVH